MFAVELLLAASLTAQAVPAVTRPGAKQGAQVEVLPGAQRKPGGPDRAIVIDPMDSWCQRARLIAAAGPCLEPENCRAYHLWKGAFGEHEGIRLRAAGAKLWKAQRAPVVGPGDRQRFRGSPRAPVTVVCPADSGAAVPR
ncbi:MAG: hypothetical protein ACE5GX_12835 [Thermoanaerobaculia bacterium]